MKPLLDIKQRVKNAAIDTVKTDLLVIGVFSESKLRSKSIRLLERKLSGALSSAFHLGDFKGNQGTRIMIYGNDRLSAKRILLVGLGKQQEVTLDTLRKAAASAAGKALQLKATTVSMSLHPGLPRALDLKEIGRVCAEGAGFGAYRYDEYVTADKETRASKMIIEIIDEDPDRLKKLKAGLHCGSVIGYANSWARTIANRPGNVINPPELAKLARSLARSSTLTCTIWDKKKLSEKGMGGILAVGNGSASDPRLIVLRHRATARAGAKRPTVALVGKAVTFDSGGISIKPSANMDQMKFDKTGGVAVLATLQAVAALKMDINVIGVVPSAENMPGGGSYRPGDIVTTYSGKTVEILNTDAEGRMILSDGIAWAAEQKADIIIDIATLTGACMVALGKHQAGLFSDDDDLVRDLKRAAELSGEKVWHLPSGKEYAEDMKSKIADLKNCGPRWGGASTAAAFLQQFAGNTKWAHLDIAGMDVYQAPGDPKNQSSSGFGVRLLTAYLMNIATR
ncbi:leucyl aminopeptidase [Planctomycetota bacterium]